MNRSIFLAIAIFLGTLGIAILPNSAQALTGSDFRAGRIIDDHVFFNGTAMGLAEIQSFLNSKVPVCDTNGAQTSEYGGGTRAQYGTSRGYPPPYVCLKDYRQDTPAKASEAGLCSAFAAGNKSAAQIIFEVSNNCGVSPKVLITLIQKESYGPLVTDDWPWSMQYLTPMGYACPDTAPCDSEYYGFFNQVYNSARQFKRYARDSTLFRYRAYRDNYIQYNPNVACGGTNIYIENQATAGLYNYTPYQPNPTALSNIYGSQNDGCSAYGNRNFWRMFSDWFGPTTGTNLVRTSSNPTYYLLTNGKRFAIPNADLLYAYGLERTELTVVSDSYLASVPDGGVLSTIFTIPGDPTVYLADGNRRYGIASAAYCTAWGLACGNPSVQKELGQQVFNTMVDGGVLKELMGNQGGIYRMVDGKKRPFFSLKALTDKGFGYGNAVTIVNYSNAIRPLGIGEFENNSFIKFAAGSGIYLHNNGKFYGLPSFEMYNNWKSAQAPLFSDAFSAYNQALPAIEFNLSSIASFGDSTPYLIDGGAKINLGGVAADWPVAADTSALANFSGLLPTKAVMNSRSNIRMTDGAIYHVKGQKKQPFASITDYFKLGYAPIDIAQLTSNSISAVPNGITLLAEGRLFKTAGSEAIYATGQNNALYSLNSLNQLGQFKFDTSSVPRVSPETFASYSAPTTLLSSVGGDGQTYIVSGGQKLLIPGSLAASYGSSSWTLSLFSPAAINQLGSGKVLGRFIQSSSGTIFYIENGSKRPISSYARFIQLGGTSENTFTVPKDALDQIPTGAVT